MKKCPPGVICVENVSFCLLCIILLVIGFFIYMNFKNNTNNTNNNITFENKRDGLFSSFLPSWPYNNLQKDVLLNPYDAPYKDERHFVQNIPVNAVPINISTNVGAVDTTYRQMGIMTPLNGVSKDNILPLMGRPLFTNRDKWQYYTISDQNNNIKLPISRNGKSCTNEYGCDKLYNGDTVYIEGINEPYRITMYDNDTIKYLPFI